MKHLRRLLPYLRPYRARYVLGILLMVAAQAVAVVSPLLAMKAIDALEAGGPGAAPRFIYYIAMAIVGLAVVRTALLVPGRFLLISNSRLVEYDLRNDLYRKLTRLPAGYYDRTSSGDLASRIINDLDGIRPVAGVGIQIAGGTVLLLIFITAAMLYLNWQLTLLSIGTLLLVSVVTAPLTRRMYERSQIVQERLADISDLAHENFSGARVVRAFTQEGSEQARMARAAGRFCSESVRLAAIRAALYGLIFFFMETAIVVTILVGGMGMIEGTFTTGEMVAFFIYLFMLHWPVIAAGWLITIVQRAQACMERLADILDAEPASDGEPRITEPPSAGAIEIRCLTFHYSEDRSPALRDVSFKVAAGERVALVGRTGSGKSTLAQILLGLYRVPSGRVFLDGRDINDYSLHALRSAIGSVPQDTFLFSDRLSENIAFGGRNGVTDDMVRGAAEISLIARDAEDFPEGLDQVIGERGVTLSGGQRQRTALARAVIRRPPILILDDALSSVDVHTERDILDRLGEFLTDRTALIVTHRFSVVRHVDRIIVLDDGRVVEEGTHDELMRNRKLYASLVERQRLIMSLEEEPDEP